MRFIKFAVLAALFALPVSSADAGVIFGVPVNIDFSGVAGGPVLSDVTGLDFGSNALGASPTGRVAVNSTDNGDGFFGLGDTINVVGHALVDEATVGGVNVNPLDGGGLPSFELTGVLRDLSGTVASNPNAPGIINDVSSGFLDFYVDTPGNFDVGDLATSEDGTLVATFELVEGATPLTGSEITSTEFVFDLVSQIDVGVIGDRTDDFFQLPSGLNPLDSGSLLLTQVITLDVRTDDVLAGISGGSVEIGADFFPGPLPSGDFFANVDGSAALGVVPEPSSLLSFIGICFVGAMRRRRSIRG